MVRTKRKSRSTSFYLLQYHAIFQLCRFNQ